MAAAVYFSQKNWKDLGRNIALRKLERLSPEETASFICIPREHCVIRHIKPRRYKQKNMQDRPFAYEYALTKCTGQPFDSDSLAAFFIRYPPSFFTITRTPLTTVIEPDGKIAYEPCGKTEPITDSDGMPQILTTPEALELLRTPLLVSAISLEFSRRVLTGADPHKALAHRIGQAEHLRSGP